MAKLAVKSMEKKSGRLERLENKKWILPAVFSVIIFVMAIWGIGNFNQLLLYDDEFGYWAASAYLTGTDWTSVTSGIPYYSYGYGFLILTPIRLIFSNTETMYQAAIVANALLLVGSYWIARNVTKQLFEKAHWALIDTVCFVVMLYPSNIVFSHIAWAECLLVFVFWVFVWLSIRVIKKPTVINHVGLACVIMYLYVVHQRTLAVIIATVMVMIYYFVVDKKRRKNIIWFTITLILLFIVHHFIKEDLLSTFYNNNTKVALNNIEGQSDKIKSIFTISGFLKLIFSIMGKWFYLTMATGLMVWWSIGGMLKDFWAELRSKTKVFSEEVVWKTYMLLTFAGSFAISAIYMIEVGRNDCLIYGRYIEFMLGFFIIYGVMLFLNDEKKERKVTIYVILGLFMAWCCQVILEEVNITTYQPYHSVASSLFFESGKSAEGKIYNFFGYMMFGAVLWNTILNTPKWKKINWIRVALLIIIPCIMWTNISMSLVLGRVTDKQIIRVTNIRSIVNWIERVDENAEVYYCVDTESRYWSESFQYLLKEHPLQVITKNEINLKEDDYYIVGDKFVDQTGFEDKYYCIKRTNQFALVVKADGRLAQKAESLKVR